MPGVHLGVGNASEELVLKPHQNEMVKERRMGQLAWGLVPHAGARRAAFRRRTGHHAEEKINPCCFALETELRPVGGIYKKPTFGSI